MEKSEKKDRPTLKKQYCCAKAKNRDILASPLTSEKIRDNGLKKGLSRLNRDVCSPLQAL
jgi:hypothetical protein